jgi:magnesium transporter
MNSSEQLALTYLRKRPAAAARVLESLAPEETAGILSEVSAQVAGEVLTAMQKYYTERCLALLGAGFIVNIAHHLASQRAASLLRVIPGSRQEEILNQLSTLHARAIRFQLSFAPNLIGAWIKMDSVTLDPDLRVADAIQRIRQVDRMDAHRLFLVDGTHQLKGAVTMSRLLQASDDQSLRDIAALSLQVLRARTSLSAAVQHSDWRQYTEMPVVMRGKEFIGVITYQVLSDTLSELRHAQNRLDNNEPQSINGLADVFRSGVYGAWQTWMDLLSVPIDYQGVTNERDTKSTRGA